MAPKQPIQEAEVQPYEEGKAIKRVHPDATIELDHIPSKQAIKEAYVSLEENLDSVRDIDDDLANKIDKITTTIARAKESHKENDTTGRRNSILAGVDSKVLALATVRDLEKYQRIELERGELSPREIELGMNDVNVKNINLDIYSQREIDIANEFAHEFANIDIRHNKEHIPTFEEIATRYDARLAETNTPKTFNEGHFNNRLAQPSIIVGATLASMIFTEKADASTLHIDPHLVKDKFDALSSSEQIGAEMGAGFNALNAGQAVSEFKDGASKSASTLLNSDAYKAGLKDISQDALKPVLTKDVVKMGVKDSAKFAGKSLLKKLPVVGFFAGIAFGIGRAMDGDFEGAGMEIASGAFSLVPGIGTAASVATDAAILERDTSLLSHSVDKLLGKENQETFTQSEDNHTTIEPKQPINLSSDVEKDGFEYNEDGMLIYTGDNVVSIDDIAFVEEESYDSLAKAQEKIAELFPEFQMNQTQESQKVEEPREERTSSYETQESNSYYVANDNIAYSEEDTLPKNHRPITLQNNLSQQPQEENQLIDEEQFRQAEQRIYDDIAQKYGSSNDYGNDRGMEID